MRHVKWVVVVLGFVAVALASAAVQGQQLGGTRSGCWSR